MDLIQLLKLMTVSSLSVLFQIRGQSICSSGTLPPVTGLYGESVLLSWQSVAAAVPVNPGFVTWMNHSSFLLVDDVEVNAQRIYLKRVTYINRTTLMLSVLAFSDEGNYIVQIISNTPCTFSIPLVVLGSVRIDLPKLVQAVNSTTANLTCVLYGRPAASVLWTRIEKPLASQANVNSRTLLSPSSWSITTSTLTISAVSLDDEGVYTCEGTNSASQAEANTTLDVQYPPSKTSMVLPPSQVDHIMEGSSIVLNCSSDADPGPQFVFDKDGEIIGSVVGSVYTIPSARLEDSGVYSCEPVNYLGAGKKAKVVVNIVAVPAILPGSSPSQVSVIGNSSVVLSCGFSSWPPGNATVLKNNQSVDGVEQELIQGPSPYRASYWRRLLLSSLTSQDADIYICVYWNSYGLIRYNITLEVLYLDIVPPRENPVEVVFFAGMTVSFECDIYSYPAANLSWYIPPIYDLPVLNMNLTQASQRLLGPYVTQGRLDVTVRSTQTISGVMCLASNRNFSKTSDHSVKFRYQPVIIGTSPTWSVSSQDDNTTLYCDADGQPAPDFSWTDVDTGRVVSTERRAVVQFPNYGHLLRCTASNYLGNASIDVHISVIYTEKLISDAGSFKNVASWLLPTVIIIALAALIALVWSLRKVTTSRRTSPIYQKNEESVSKDDDATNMKHRSSVSAAGGLADDNRTVSGNYFQADAVLSSPRSFQLIEMYQTQWRPEERTDASTAPNIFASPTEVDEPGAAAGMRSRITETSAQDTLDATAARLASSESIPDAASSPNLIEQSFADEPKADSVDIVNIHHNPSSSEAIDVTGSERVNYPIGIRRQTVVSEISRPADDSSTWIETDPTQGGRSYTPSPVEHIDQSSTAKIYNSEASYPRSVSLTTLMMNPKLPPRRYLSDDRS